MKPLTVNLHAFLPRSKANGPGNRAVVWLQGCSLGCPGCFNPTTHAPSAGIKMAVPELLEKLERLADSLEGLTISGGEPMEQSPALYQLLSGLRSRTPWSFILFSGYEKREILDHPLGPAILGLVDVLIDGRFQARAKTDSGLRGSENQTLHFLTDRYGPGDFVNLPVGEVVIQRDGVMDVTGIVPWRPGPDPCHEQAGAFDEKTLRSGT